MVTQKEKEIFRRGEQAGYVKGWEAAHKFRQRPVEVPTVNERFASLEEGAENNLALHVALSEVLVTLQKWIEHTNDRLDGLENPEPVEEESLLSMFVEGLTQYEYDKVKYLLHAAGIDTTNL